MNEWIGEPARKDIEREFSRWETYASFGWQWARLRANPDVKVRGEDLTDLRDMIRRAEALGL